MFAAIDFGTSNCAAALWVDGAVRRVDLEDGEPLLPSELFIPRRPVDPQRVDEDRLQLRVDRALGALRADNSHRRREGLPALRVPERTTLERAERQIMQRELRAAARSEEAAQSPLFALRYADDAEVEVGRRALEHHFLDPTGGYYVRSPKSFLAADLGEVRLGEFTLATARVLGQIKARVDAAAGTPVTRAVLGRPVRYQGTAGRSGEQQALDVMVRAASLAGFDEVRFVMEPVAAAHAFERDLDRATTVLVVDVGGGTTDCCVLRLGGDHASGGDRPVLATSGGRVGGQNLDMLLTETGLMPALGRESLLEDGRPVPNIIYHKAANVADVHAQEDFYRSTDSLLGWRRRARQPELLDRLLKLLEQRGTYRLVNCGERAKIDLSDARHIDLDLGWLEAGLQVTLDEARLQRAAEGVHTRMLAIVDEAVATADTDIDCVFTTGGASRSPALRDGLAARLGNLPIIRGDDFGSVCSGLVAAAPQAWRQA